MAADKEMHFDEGEETPTFFSQNYENVSRKYEFRSKELVF